MILDNPDGDRIQQAEEYIGYESDIHHKVTNRGVTFILNCGSNLRRFIVRVHNNTIAILIEGIEIKLGGVSGGYNSYDIPVQIVWEALYNRIAKHILNSDRPLVFEPGNGDIVLSGICGLLLEILEHLRKVLMNK